MIDTHAHLGYFKDLDGLIDNMQVNGLEYIVNIGTTIKDSEQGVNFANRFKNVYTTVGIYPEYSMDVTDEDLLKIMELGKNDKVVAIGEIGLDYHGENFDKNSQRQLFIKQLEIADKLSLPFCIHCRGAVEDVYQILNENKNLIKHAGLMHCYSEGSEWVRKFLDLGLYISFSGNITYKKNDRSFLKDMPLDKILVETDSPYLAPEPLRGRQNEPKNVKFTLQRIADEIGIGFDELERITSENAKRIYYKIKG